MDTNNLSKEEVLSYDAEYCLRPWAVQKNQNPIPVARADGIFFWDYDGKRYYDMSSQLVNVNLGFGNREINDAIVRQLQQYPYIAPAHATEARGKLAKLLIEKSPKNMRKVFFTCGGAESNDNAVIIAREVTGRTKIFSRYRSYHGSTLGAGNLSGDPRRFGVEKPEMPGYIKFFDPYVYREPIRFANDAEASHYYLAKLREQIICEGPHKIAAIALETITGSNGVFIPPDGYLAGVRRLCDEFGILLIFDEVMTGFGRTGKLFSFENWGVIPDIITFAKGITCGYVQLGGVIVNDRISAYYDTRPLLNGLTYAGHALACAAGYVTLNYYYEHNVFENVNRVGQTLGQTLEGFKEKHKCVGDVRYIGLFSAVELVKDKDTREPLVSYSNDEKGVMNKIIGLLRERGFATFGRENNIVIAPPLIIEEKQLRDALMILDEVLGIVDRELV